MYDKILVPLDGSQLAEVALPYAEELASKLQAEVVLLQVMAEAYHVYAMGEVSSQMPYTEDEMEPLKAKAKSYLEKVSNGLKSKGITTSSEVRVGAAAEEIIKFADEIHADVVAMSTHGLSGISRWVFGSVADRVLRGGNTPVLLVRNPRASTK